MLMTRVRILTMMAKSRRTSRTSIAPMVLHQLQQSLAARGQMVQMVRDGRAGGAVAAGGDRVLVPVDRRAAAIANVSSSFTTEAAHLRGLCVFGTSGGRNLGWCFTWQTLFLAMLLCCVRVATGQDVPPQK